jgi:hypothetical protein
VTLFRLVFQLWRKLIFVYCNTETYFKRIGEAIANVQGGQMKSGQILSRNNSKTVLNIVFKFYTLVTEYISCLQRPVAAQWLQVSDLWQRLRGRRLKESALSHDDILTDSKIADLTGVNCRRENELRRGSDRDQGPQASCFMCTKSPDGLQEGQEEPLTSLRLASGSTRTSI